MKEILLEDIRNIQIIYSQIKETTDTLITAGFSDDAPVIDNSYKYLDEIVRLVGRVHSLTDGGVNLVYFYLFDCNFVFSGATYQYVCYGNTYTFHDLGSLVVTIATNFVED